MRTLAIIPARGGSKRVPGKNLLEVGGVSMVKAAALSATPCTNALVSTDDPAIWNEPWHREPAGLHVRKPEHATDDAQLEPVIDDVLSEHPGYDAVVLLQPTSPLRTAAHVAEALRVLAETGCDSVVAVTRLHSLHPVFNGNTQAGGGSGGVYEPRSRGIGRPPSSSLSHLVYENGAIYAFTLDHWNRTKSRMGGDMRCIVLHWSEAVEVDTLDDLEAVRRLGR